MKPEALIDKKQIALVHVAAKALGLTEDDYRMTLRRVGVESSKDLTARQMDELMSYYGRLGFRARAKNGKPRRFKGPSGKKPLLSKIKALLTELKLPDEYADGVARQMFKIEKTEWCDPDQLRKIAAALTYKLRRACN